MNKLALGKSIKDIFDCSDGHKVILCKNNPTKQEYMCLVCDNVVNVKDNDSNIIYTNKSDLELINSLSKMKYEFLCAYYDNDESIIDAVNYINNKDNNAGKSKTTM